MKQPQVIENKSVTAPAWLPSVFSRNGVSCSQDQIQLLGRFAELLLQWNKNLNLISRKDEENIWEGHILHSLSPLLMFRWKEDAAILDLGTGGGLPGLPLKILLPRAKVVMIDATQKKITAVRSMIESLGLSQSEAVWGRAEEIGRDTAYQHKFDYVLARGVAPLSDLVVWAKPFLTKHASHGGSLRTSRKRELLPGSLLAYKGGSLEEETEKARRLGRTDSIELFDIVFKGSERLPGLSKKLVVAVY